MSKQEIGDEEIKAVILYRLIRRHCWGAKYLPVDTLINWMSKQIRKKGKRIRRCVRELIKDRCILFHKGGRAISLNLTKSKEILEYIKRFMKI
jgi:hypothetical protein